MVKRVILYGDTSDDRYFALRTAEHLIAAPEKRDVIITFNTSPKEVNFYAYWTRTRDAVVARRGE